MLMVNPDENATSSAILLDPATIIVSLRLVFRAKAIKTLRTSLIETM